MTSQVMSPNRNRTCARWSCSWRQCRAFEDNVGALELANTHKLRPRTKHLAVQLHHFRQHVLDKTIAVEKVDAQHQRADMFAKALPRDAFRHLRKTIIGWQCFARECRILMTRWNLQKFPHVPSLNVAISRSPWFFGINPNQSLLEGDLLLDASLRKLITFSTTFLTDDLTKLNAMTFTSFSILES